MSGAAQERRKRDNLIAAVENGTDAPAAIVRAIAEREPNIKRLEQQLEATGETRRRWFSITCRTT